MGQRLSGMYRLLVLPAAMLAGEWATADQPLVPPEWAPSYQLGSPRMERDQFGRSNLVFTFRRVRSGRGLVQLKAREPSGPVNISGVTFAFQEDSGEIQLTSTMGFGFMSAEQPDIEFYLVTNASMAGKSYGEFLISNVVRMGNPGPATTARPWDATEQAAHEKDKLAEVPPTSLPDGYVAITAAQALVPGMPIKVGYYGDWVDGEVIALKQDGQIGVKLAPNDRIAYFQREKWLAADPAVLERAVANPAEFTPSVRVLPGGTTALPNRSQPIDPDLELPPGTPLLTHFGDWTKVIVVEDRGDSIVVHFSGRPSFADHAEKRVEMAILTSTLERIGQPGTAEEFAQNLQSREQDDDKFGSMRRQNRGSDAFNDSDSDTTVIDRSYPIRIALPKLAEKLPTDLELPEETLVAYCWGRRWQAAKVVSDEGEKVVVREDDSITDFAYRIDREQLIIQTKTLRALKRASDAGATDLTKTLRTWTDVSGEHKIEARFVSTTETDVTLQTDAGREITLPIAKLCAEDQALVERVKTKVENPFAP